jgi:UDP-glucose 6-dehydrogenase
MAELFFRRLPGWFHNVYRARYLVRLKRLLYTLAIGNGVDDFRETEFQRLVHLLRSAHTSVAGFLPDVLRRGT